MSPVLAECMFSVKEMAVRMADTHKVCSNREREPRDVMIESLDRSGKANDKRTAILQYGRIEFNQL